MKRNLDLGAIPKINDRMPEIRRIEEKLGATGIRKEYKIDSCKY